VLKAGGGLIGLLVVIAALVLPRLLSGGGSQEATSTPEVADGTCSSELEQVVCGATNDVQDYWQVALPQFFQTQYRETKTTFFTGGVGTSCGQATSQTGPFYCPADELIYIDLEFMQQLERQLIGQPTDLAEQYIVAHEYGHHVQNVLGDSDRVRQAQQSDPDRANEYSVGLELQADCYAGVWVGDIARRGLLESSDEVNEALDAAAGVGDDRIQSSNGGRVDPDSFTHGTSEQRQTWFQQGFDSLDPTTCDTLSPLL